MLEVFARVILPRLPKTLYPAAANRALTALREMEELGIPLLRVSPALLFAEPSLAEKISADIEAGLASKAEDTARRAIFAVQSWGLLSVRSEPPLKVPSTLVDELVDKVFFRMPPALPSALASAGDMIEHVPTFFSAQSIAKLLHALKQLATETEIISVRPEAIDMEQRITIESGERPSVRRYAAFLASQLFDLATRSGEAPSPVLQIWEEIGRNDRLPEVEW